MMNVGLGRYLIIFQLSTYFESYSFDLQKTEKSLTKIVDSSDDKAIIEQMEKMEIMKQDDAVSATTPMTPDTDPAVTTRDDDVIGEEGELVTDPTEDMETTTVIATSISTSEAISYFSSVSIANNQS